MRVQFWLSGCLIAAIGLSACAGREPNPVEVVQAKDQTASCSQLAAEISTNNVLLRDLAREQNLKLAQNVVAGVGGVVTLGLSWFALDAQGSAKTDATALSARNKYLAMLAAEQCARERWGFAPPPHASRSAFSKV